MLLPWLITHFETGTPPWPVLFIYLLAVIAFVVCFVHWREESTTAERFGAECEGLPQAGARLVATPATPHTLA